jgi:hypothetical protein
MAIKENVFSAAKLTKYTLSLGCGVVFCQRNATTAIGLNYKNAACMLKYNVGSSCSEF